MAHRGQPSRPSFRARRNRLWLSTRSTRTRIVEPPSLLMKISEITAQAPGRKEQGAKPPAGNSSRAAITQPPPGRNRRGLRRLQAPRHKDKSRQPR